MTSDDGSFDFKSDESLRTSFAADYLRQYYSPSRPVTDDETAVYTFIKSISNQLKSTEDCLEVGCGPTLHHAIMLAPFVKTLTLSDYLEENLLMVKDWIAKANHAWDWSAFTKLCQSIDGNATDQTAISNREKITRSKIKNLLPINLLNDHPLGAHHGEYDLVASFYCTEEVALTIPRWQTVMRGIASLVKPQGKLLLSCLHNTDFYHICGADGEVKELPCARITESELRETLQKTGFIVAEDSVQLAHTPEQSTEGVSGVLLAFVIKK